MSGGPLDALADADIARVLIYIELGIALPFNGGEIVYVGLSFHIQAGDGSN